MHGRRAGKRERAGRLAPRWAGPAIILLAAAVATAPELVRGPSCGHDFDFHLVSWLDALSSWRQGILYPHWAPSANFGAGEPRFVFYPPLTWMLGAALGAGAAVVAVSGGADVSAAGGGRSGYAGAGAADAGRRRGDAGRLRGDLLRLRPFHRLRALGIWRLAGGFWIPLLLLFASCATATPDAQCVARGHLDGSAAPLALVMAGAWLSNAPLGVMASYLLAAVALAAAWQWRSWAPVVRARLAAALGMGLAAVYLVPAAVEQRWVDIRQAIDDPGLTDREQLAFRAACRPGAGVA